MAKLYRTSGTGNAQQTLDVNDEKIKIYADETSLDADLANINENEIVATNEEDSQRAGTQYPVDVVQDGNMNAVTSNAVALALNGNSKIKVARVTKPRTIFQGSQYGFVQINEFPTDFTAADVIGIATSSDGIYDAYGLQITYGGGENGTHFFWYYIPNHIDFEYNTRSVTFQITYFSNT